MAGILAAWQARHPVLAIVLVSLLAVVINCHPVIFGGRSFVSPASTGVLVYSWPPLFPGLPPGAELSVHGSDTPAMMLGGVPEGFIESRTLPHGELPLWNRYGHAGTTFIGQAISMLGDPLQLVVIFGRGAAWAWDLKYLIAKFLFCAGFGLLVLRRLGSPGLSLIFAATAAYCGAFFYVNNHPVFFVFCYAPWVLLSALELLDRKAGRGLDWGLVWLWANVGCFCGGHVEPAVLVIGALNLAAVAWALAECRRAAECGAVLGRMAVAAVLFLGLTAPVWMSFFGALDGAVVNGHAEARVHQLPARFLAGAFDDLLYLLLRPSDDFPAVAPGTSLLVLCGCVLSVRRWRQLKPEPFFWVNTAALVLWAGCIFGWVPASLLVRIPLLNRDGHTEVDFSYVLVIHLTLQAAYGFKALAQERKVRRVALDFIWVALVLAGMLAAYDFGVSHRPIPWHYFLGAGAGALGAPALFAWWHSRGLRISAAGWTVIILLGLAAQFRFGIYAFGEKSLLMLVGPRLALDASSPAIDRVKSDRSGPFRVVGMQYNLYGDYAAVYGLEDIRSCAPLTSGAYLDLLQNFPGMKLAYVWILEVKDPVAAQPLLNLLNVKYLLGPTNLAPPGADWRMTDRSDFTVMENLEVWPRAYFTDRVESIATTAEFIQRLAADARQPLAALTPEEIATEPGLGRLTATTNAVVLAATNYQLCANSTAFDIHAPSAGIVCLTEGQAKGFTATANGAPAAVLIVNRAFKGVYLDRRGDYHIEFTYRPAHWRAACILFWLAAAGAAALAIAGLVCARRDRRQARANRES